MNEQKTEWIQLVLTNLELEVKTPDWHILPLSSCLPQPTLKLISDQKYKSPSIMHPAFSWNIHSESPWIAHPGSWLFFSESRTLGRPIKGILRAKAWKSWLLGQLFQVHRTKASSCEKEHRIKTAFSPHHHLQPCVPHIMVTGRY